MQIKEHIELIADYTEQNLTAFLKNSDSDYQSVIKAMQYSTLGGGKRIRPFIMFQFNTLCGGRKSQAVNFACALEMIHTYSLIHDDLPCMDNDDVRRGKPSCHKAFGEDTALLAGDALLTKAFYIAAQTKESDAENILKSIKELASLSGIDGMIGGQVIDLESEKKQISIELMLKMYSLKTCALLKAAAKIGCILAGADEHKINAATEYAENIGLAFQIMDDILDVTGEEQKLGKPVGSDNENNKSTFVALYGLETARKKVDELTEKAVKSLYNFEADTTVLKDLAFYLAKRDY